MTNEEKTNDNPTMSQRDYDQEAAIDSLMDQIQPGFRLTVYRVSPAWCDGYLEEYEIDPNTPIDLAYLASTWGGDVLRIKLRDQKGKIRGGATLNFKSYPPKFRGVPITPDSVDMMYHRGNYPGFKSTEQKQDIERVQTIQNQQASPANVLSDMLQVLQKTRKEDLGIVRTLLDGAEKVPKNPFEQMMEAAHMYKEMSKIFGTGEAAMVAPASDDSQLFGTIADIVKVMASSKQQQAPQPRYIQAPPPRIQPLPPSPGLTNNQAPKDVVGDLAAMEAAKAADLFMNVLQRMGPEKAQKMFVDISARLGLTNDLGSSDDEYDDEYDDEVETDSDPDPSIP